MREIYALYAGTGRPEDVLGAATGGTPEQQVERKFYAHLYLGLYLDAHGQGEQAMEHLRKAVLQYPKGHYMGDVARVHLRRMEAAVARGTPGEGPTR